MEEKKKGGLWLRVVLSIVGSGVLVAAIGYLLFFVLLSVLWGRLGKGLEADKEALRKIFGRICRNITDSVKVIT